jgi:hypothetical protein
MCTRIRKILFLGSRARPTTLPPSVSRFSSKCGTLNISRPYRPPRPVTGIASLFLHQLHEHIRSFKLNTTVAKAASQSLLLAIVGTACSTHGGRTALTHFWLGDLEESDRQKQVSVGEWMILKRILANMMPRRCRLSVSCEMCRMGVGPPPSIRSPGRPLASDFPRPPRFCPSVSLSLRRQSGSIWKSGLCLVPLSSAVSLGNSRATGL